jgi:hypothetical protein
VLPDDKCKKCEFGNVVEITRNPLQVGEVGFTFGWPAPAADKINQGLMTLRNAGIVARVTSFEVPGKLLDMACCEKTLGAGRKQEGSVSAKFVEFTGNARIWPLGPIPPPIQGGGSVFGITYTFKADLVGGWFADLSGNVQGTVGHKKNDCSLDAADRAGCYFAELNTTITVGSSISVSGSGSVTIDCPVCNSATGKLTVKGGGAVNWPMNISQVQYNSASCSSGLVGGIFQAGSVNAKISAQVDGEVSTATSGPYAISPSVGIVDCSIDSQLNVTCQ